MDAAIRIAMKILYLHHPTLGVPIPLTELPPSHSVRLTKRSNLNLPSENQKLAQNH